MQNSGLLPLPKDPRDYAYFKTFGAAVIKLPEEYSVGKPFIKDQANTDFCPGESSSAVNEDEEGIEFSPEWQFSQIKKVMGEWKSYGADLRSAAKALKNAGSLPKSQAPFSVHTNDRDFLANWNNWPYALQQQAALYRKESFFMIDTLPGHDLFDSIRTALYQNAIAKRSIMTGSVWYQEWTYAPGGVLPEDFSQPVGLHSYKIFGWTMIGGQPYLMVQNSYGEDMGDKGVYYMPRSAANKVLDQGLFMFRDLPEGTTPKPNGNFLQLLIFILKQWTAQHLKH